MIPNGLITQIAITALSLGIIFTYVKPAMESITQKQDQIAVYQTELKQVKEVNERLATLASQMNSIDSLSQRRLLTYMPDSVDTIGVPRTVEAIAREARVTLNEVTHEEGAEDSGNVYVEEVATPRGPEKVEFNVSITGDYPSIKRFLSLLEQNEYPLEVAHLGILPGMGAELNVELLLHTYHHKFSALTADPATGMIPSGETL